MRFLSLFAGIGGFDLGLERAGHSIPARRSGESGDGGG
jgi:site-specific DNA-cytosine methylase